MSNGLARTLVIERTMFLSCFRSECLYGQEKYELFLKLSSVSLPYTEVDIAHGQMKLVAKDPA